MQSNSSTSWSLMRISPKAQDELQIENAVSKCTLTPEVPLSSATNSAVNLSLTVIDGSSEVKRVGRYIIFNEYKNEIGSRAGHQVSENHFEVRRCRAVNLDNHTEYICKVMPGDKYRQILAAYFCVGSHSNIACIEEIILGSMQAYAIFPCNHGDLHSYVRSKRRLPETEAVGLFSQILHAVRWCQKNGVLLRDVKLRKFVFRDELRTQLMLDSLEDAKVLSSDLEAPPTDVFSESLADDYLTDRHGCPAYVSPEMLLCCSGRPSPSTNVSSSMFNTPRDQLASDDPQTTLPIGYSGRAAEVWSLGVVLYTMLTGQYPFYAEDPALLFSQICRGSYVLPNETALSSTARCLIRSLLTMNPKERFTVDDALKHPWLVGKHRVNESIKRQRNSREDRQGEWMTSRLGGVGRMLSSMEERRDLFSPTGVVVGLPFTAKIGGIRDECDQSVPASISTHYFSDLSFD